MRFYTKQHPFYCGIDLHARTMYVCLLSQDGEVVLHRNTPAGPETFRVCPTFYTHGSSGIRGPFSINAAISRDKYFIA
jgi:hypothetical protein